MCACGGKSKICKHIFLDPPLCASPCSTLFSTLQLKSPSLSYLLGNPHATKATACSGRFNLLYCLARLLIWSFVLPPASSPLRPTLYPHYSNQIFLTPKEQVFLGGGGGSFFAPFTWCSILGLHRLSSLLCLKQRMISVYLPCHLGLLQLALLPLHGLFSST